ncbi:uncharacterized protein LOC141601454 [Silene latifolia]|uniref:uncharacterized protein LOC141601454 n=1 Tax=Silene latifolia TaxID=37657 RepID=UPI003D76FFC5
MPPSVTFDEIDAGSTPEQHHDALIITLPIGNCKVKKILVDTGSSVNLIMMETLKGMGFTEKDLAKKAIPSVGFSGETKHSLGEIIIPTYAGGVNKQVRYLVIDGPSTYNVILGRPWIHEMKAIPSTYHQCLKFPTPWGVQEIRGDQEEAKDCYKVALKPTTEQTVLIGSECRGKIREELVRLLRTNIDCFAWSHDDMIGIDPSVITHKLSVDPSYKPVQQKRRKFASERNQVINQEVDNLLAAGKIREVKYPEWLSNVVVVPKKNGKWKIKITPVTRKRQRSDPREDLPIEVVNMMFKEQIGQTMEVYIDDMVVKSKQPHKDHQRLAETFNTLGKYQMKKSQRFEWTDDNEKAYQELKRYLSTPPLLSKPEPGEPLFLYHRSTKQIGAVLVREQEGSQHPVYYISKSLLPAETMYTSLEKLVLALVTASYKLRPYFESHTISVITNYPLKTIMRKPELSGRMAKWSVHLSGYDLKFEPRTAIKSQALADFVSDFCPALQTQAEQDILNLEEDKGEQVWELHVDGASNAKGAGVGLVLKSPQGDLIVQAVRCEFKATNNGENMRH